jgi:Na+-transporting NADH:ubiquinone oxidoreductase subunit NqrD
LYSGEGVRVGSGLSVGDGVGVGVGVGVATTAVGVGRIVAGGILLGCGAVITEVEKTSDIYTSKVFIRSMAAASFLTLLSFE